MVKNFSDGMLVVSLAYCLVVMGSTPADGSQTLDQNFGGPWATTCQPVVGHQPNNQIPPNTPNEIVPLGIT